MMEFCFYSTNKITSSSLESRTKLSSFFYFSFAEIKKKLKKKYNEEKV